jgi:hypothetical protein
MKVNDFIMAVLDHSKTDPSILNKELQLYNSAERKSYATDSIPTFVDLSDDKYLDIVFNNQGNIADIRQELEGKALNPVQVLNGWSGLYTIVKNALAKIETPNETEMCLIQQYYYNKLIENLQGIKAIDKSVELVEDEGLEFMRHIDVEINFNNGGGHAGIRAFITITKDNKNEIQAYVQDEFYGTIPQEDNYFEDININNLIAYLQ